MSVYSTHSEKETISCGNGFASKLSKGDVVAVYGDLGSGKTRFIKGICEGLGVREHVVSPTFTIVTEYESAIGMVYHFDLYRVNSIEEIRDLGFEEYLNYDGVSLIEWAEKAQPLLPERRFEVRLELGADEYERRISIQHATEVVS